MDARMTRGARRSAWALCVPMLAGACGRSRGAHEAAPIAVRAAAVGGSRVPRGVPAGGTVARTGRAPPRAPASSGS